MSRKTTTTGSTSSSTRGTSRSQEQPNNMNQQETNSIHHEHFLPLPLLPNYAADTTSNGMSGFVENDFYPAIDDDLSLRHGVRFRLPVADAASSSSIGSSSDNKPNNNNTVSANSNSRNNFTRSMSSLSTSSLSSSASGTGSETGSSTSESDEDLEESIAYLVEKQALLMRFAVTLQQEDYYEAATARAAIALKEAEEQASLSSGTSVSFPFSEDDSDSEVVDPEDLGNGNIWHKAKKILHSLSKQRGIMYHASSSTSVSASKKSKANKKKQQQQDAKNRKRSVRFEPEAEADDVDTEKDMQDQRSKCARIDKTHVRLMMAKNYQKQSDSAVFEQNHSEVLMTTLHSCLAETTGSAFSPWTTSSALKVKGVF